MTRSVAARGEPPRRQEGAPGIETPLDEMDLVAQHRAVVANGEHLFAQLDLRDVTVDGIELVVELPLGPRVTNARGGLQGGLLATLADIVAGRMAMTGCPAGRVPTTTDLTIHYLAPVSIGPARGEGRVLRRGHRSVVVQVDIRDAGTDRLAAVSTVSFALVTLGERSAEPRPRTTPQATAGPTVPRST